MSLRGAWGARKAPPDASVQAVADAAAERAVVEIARLRDQGREVRDEADFIAREIQQAVLDMRKAREDAR